MSTSCSTHVLFGYAVPESFLDYVFDVDEGLYGDEEYSMRIEVSRDAYCDTWAYIGYTYSVMSYDSKPDTIDVSDFDPVKLSKTIDTFFPLLNVKPEDIKLHVYPYWY